MTAADLLARRRSIRAFRPDPVPADVLDRLLAAAQEAPSWSNTQPYRLGLAHGALRDRLADELTAAFDRGSVDLAPEIPLPLSYPPELQRRRQATGYGLYETLGIARQDHAARHAQMRRNFTFFDAPVVLFLFAHEALGQYAALDAGVFLQSLMLAAVDEGLGTCAEGALAMYPGPIRRCFDVPEGYKLLCGLSLGYPADDRVNGFRPARKAPDELLLPVATG
ncbi:MAG: nitroreductase [Alphaproteobacteria bacterium]|jgi:nitroreductase|nr:nitroreductase [Alphaproteobacteria bacterium]